MPNEVNIYTPRYLAEVVRQAPPIHTYFRDTFFTNIKTFSTERVDIDLVKGDRRMAAFVHPRVGGQVLKANGFSTESYKPPLINPYDVTTADQHMTRLPGEDLYSGMTPAQRAARKLMDEYNRLNDATTRREEWMCAQTMILRYQPDVVINTGVAGGIGPDLKVLDVVLATAVVQHDMDTSPLGDPVGYISGLGCVEMPCDAALCAALGLVILLLDFRRVRQRHLELQQILKSLPTLPQTLPQPQAVLELSLIHI